MAEAEVNQYGVLQLPKDEEEDVDEKQLLEMKEELERLKHEEEKFTRRRVFQETKNIQQILMKNLNLNLTGKVCTELEKITAKNQLNAEVLASLRLKEPDLIERAWSFEGKLFVRYRRSDRRETVSYEKYREWLDKPWPQKNTTASQTYARKVSAGSSNTK
ncbi:hypothetical protein DPMN_050803 [Dreissena polymorpha]|uniref:Uncharacterized protein n=1 Tax=Dreissena polymorpha TaxID=45954 RepID=A0A9D4HNC9_DREPO|nr:hypothetical protein DPMN_050803 [Dreissena polymorpha]